MNGTDLVFKALSALHRRQLLDVHLNPVTPHGNRGSLRFFLSGGPSQPLLLQNAQDRTSVCPREMPLQFLGNPNRSMVRMLHPVADYRSPILSGNNSLMRERSRALVQRTVSLYPPLDRGRIYPKTLSQLSNAHSRFMQPFDFLALFQCQSSLGMESHGFPYLCPSILKYVHIYCQYT
jgi:hypothetical protein